MSLLLLLALQLAGGGARQRTHRLFLLQAALCISISSP
jgi:hypothetical protein